MKRFAAGLAVVALIVVGAGVSWALGAGAAGASRAHAQVVAPVALLAQGGYFDISDAGVHRPAVEALALEGAFTGTECAEGRFCPGEPLLRWVMAVWLVRILDSDDPASAPDAGFADVDSGEWWAPHVNRLAEMGVTTGCRTDPLRYCPDRAVTRAQMASFLARAFELEPGPRAGFTDVDPANVHRANIDALAAAGVTKGCRTDPLRYCGLRSITRAQMASFLHRAVSLPRGELAVAVESSSPLVVDGSFDVTITFSEPVSGFELSGTSVVNGTATNLAGAGAAYTATIEPAADGTVMVRVPAASAQGKRGAVNAPSDPFVRTRASDTRAMEPGIHTWDRSAVRLGYLREFTREEPDAGYTGDSDNCVAGSTSQAFRDSVVQRVNWYRRMSGLGAVTERPEYSAAAQHAALMTAVQGRLSHYPDSNWACYSATGAAAAAMSNLHLRWSSYPAGIAGIDAISGYMQDSGAGNTAAGHRRWILYPQLLEIGTGDALHAGDSYTYGNVLHVFDDNLWAARPEVRERRGFVAWPPSGYVPAQTVWGRWSFSLQHAEFSSATVAVADDSGPVQVEIVTRDSDGSAPENAIVWAVGGDTNSAVLPEPDDGDHCYLVTIEGVRVGRSVEPPYEYAVCVLDPSS